MFGRTAALGTGMNILTDFGPLITIYAAAFFVMLGFFLLSLQIFVALIAFKLGSLAAADGSAGWIAMLASQVPWMTLRIAALMLGRLRRSESAACLASKTFFLGIPAASPSQSTMGGQTMWLYANSAERGDAVLRP